MTYDIRAKIALIGILLVTLATLTGNIFGWRWAAAVWLWLVCALVAVVWIEDPVRQPALRRHFSGRDYRAFYPRWRAAWPAGRTTGGFMTGRCGWRCSTRSGCWCCSGR